MRTYFLRTSLQRHSRFHAVLHNNYNQIYSIINHHTIHILFNNDSVCFHIQYMQYSKVIFPAQWERLQRPLFPRLLLPCYDFYSFCFVFYAMLPNFSKNQIKKHLKLMKYLCNNSSLCFIAPFNPFVRARRSFSWMLNGLTLSFMLVKGKHHNQLLNVSFISYANQLYPNETILFISSFSLLIQVHKNNNNNL